MAPFWIHCEMCIQSITEFEESFAPKIPDLHLHVKLLILSIHSAPLLQGASRHSLMLISQNLPKIECLFLSDIIIIYI